MFGDEFDAQALPAVRALPHVVYPDSWGYDGQFYAQLALEPTLRDPALLRALDAPSYRARRMLFSWSAYAAGLGRPAWVLQAYAWQNVIAWLVLAVLLLSWCPPGSARHFAAWFACLFTNGMLASVRQALTDGPSMVLIAVSVLATERGRSGLATGIVALAGLGRETNILAGAALAPPPDARATSLARYAVRGLLIVLPLVAWTAYVRYTLGSADAGIATLDVPLRSFLQKWFLTVAGAGARRMGEPRAIQLTDARESHDASGIRPLAMAGLAVQPVVACGGGIRGAHGRGRLVRVGGAPGRDHPRRVAADRRVQHADRARAAILGAAGARQSECVRGRLDAVDADTICAMRARTFSHVGLTVSDFNAAVRFYCDVFGCPLVGVSDTPPERVKAFFGVDAPVPTCKIGWIRVPGGGVLEIFAFEPKQPAAAIPWNRVGLTHFSFNVRHLQKWHDHLVSRGVEIVTKPERSPRGHSFFFVRDFDGNLIELMDLGYMYHVLNWLGPLGGWIFRRGMYQVGTYQPR